MSEPSVLHNARFVRLQFADPTNIVRYRVFPIQSFRAILTQAKPRVSIAKAVLGVAFLHIAEGFSAAGEYYFVPDLTTLRQLPYKPGHVSCIGFFQEKKGETSDVNVCPRTLLKSAIARAKESGLEYKVGFEIEFILLKSTSPVVAVHQLEHYSGSLALPTGSVEEIVMEEIVQSLQGSGIEVVMFHPEGAPGQYEISTGPLPPLEAADALVLSRETIYGIANKHGLRATLAPNVHAESAGSGAHIHISVNSANSADSSPSPPVDRLTEIEASFVSGLVSQFPALMAFTLPLPASYARVSDGVWSGGTYICWGIDNREVPIRLCNPEDTSSRNFEIKTVDGLANPYIALAAIITAGLSGQRDFAMKPCLDMSAVEIGKEGRAELGIDEDIRIPTTWEEARENLEGNEIFRKAFGSDMIQKYLNLNKSMADALQEPKSEEDRLSLLVQMY